MIQDIINAGFHEPYEESNPKYSIRDLYNLIAEIILRARKFIPKKSQELEQKVMSAVSSTFWRLFYADIDSVANITQHKGETGYTLIHHDSRKRTLYLAKELMFDLPEIELAGEMIVSELLKPGFPEPAFKSLFPDNYQPGKKPLKEYIRELISKRAIHYSIAKLSDNILDYLFWFENKQEPLSPPCPKQVYIDEIKRVVQQIVKNQDKRLNPVIEYLSGEPFTGEHWLGYSCASVARVDGWTTLYRKLRKNLRHSISNGDIKKICLYVTDLNLINAHLSQYTNPDKWLIEEEKKCVNESNQFYTGLEQNAMQSENELEMAISENDIESASNTLSDHYRLFKSYDENKHVLEIKRIHDIYQSLIPRLQERYKAHFRVEWQIPEDLQQQNPISINP